MRFIWIIVIMTIQLHLCAQNVAFKEFSIEKNSPCNTVIEQFKKQYGVLVAYNPQLTHALTDSRTIESYSVDSLFVKLCQVMQLEYSIADGKHSFLVRSQPKDIDNATHILHHVNIKNSEDGSPIPYAIVYDESKKYYGITDESGDCFIKIPKNAKVNTLFTHALGHKDEVIQKTDTGYNEVKLIYDPIMATPITIQNLKRSLSFASKNDAIVVQGQGLDRLGESGIFHRDVVRLMQLLPGVSAINDTKSGLRIRGSNEEATLMILDEMPIYKADHFYGIFSAINGLYINKMELYKNNIPVTYGGRTSGLLHMSSHNKPDSTELQVDIQLLQLGGLLRLPFHSHHSFTFAGRKSYFDLAKSNYFDAVNQENSTLNDLLAGGNTVTSRPKFDFYDYHAKYSFEKDNHTLSINVFNSQDDLKNTYTNTFSNSNGEVQVNDAFEQAQNWSNITQSINYGYKNPKFDFNTTIFHSEYKNNSITAGTLLRMFENKSFKDSLNINSNNSINDFGLRATLEMHGNVPLTLGFESIRHENALKLTDDSGSAILNTQRTGSEISLFAKTKLGSTVVGEFSPGLRMTAVPSINKFAILPQLQWKRHFGDNLFLKSSFGRQMQVIRGIDHESVLGTTQSYFALSNDINIPIGLGYNTMLGAWMSFGDFTLDVEGYYKFLEGAILHASQKPELRKPGSPNSKNQFQIFQGEQKTIGIDITMAYETKRIFTLLSYTLSSSENRFEKLFKNQYFPAAEDARHQVKWANTLTFGAMDFSITYISASGRPYLDFSNFRLPRDRSEIDLGDYTKHLPSYQRLDLSAFYNFSLFRQSAKAGVSVFNVTDHINVKYKQFVHEIDLPNAPSMSAILGTDIAQLNRTWNASLLLTIR
ncbi:MAG: TonB-dependent receptor plug domain-containing protein [Saprospiraceae bacterium]